MSLLEVLGRARAIDVRPIRCADRDFLMALYASTRSEEMAATGWPVQTRQAFLAQQFECQHRYYQQEFVGAEFLLLLKQGRPIGRLYWQAGSGQGRLIDIAILPRWRGQGLGTSLLDLLVRHADAHGLCVELQVVPGNPAQRWYRRHGFEPHGDDGFHVQMLRPTSQLVCA